MSDKSLHAGWVLAWEQGREIPAEVCAVKDWLLEQFPAGGVLGDADYERVAQKANAEQWQREEVKAGMMIWQLSTMVDATDKPAA